MPGRFTGGAERGVRLRIVAPREQGSACAAEAQAGSDLTWPEHPPEWMFIRTARTQRNLTSIEFEEGDASFFDQEIAESGTILIGADWVADARTVCAKSLLMRGPFDAALASFPVAAAKTGQRAEIRPMTDPRRLRGPGEVLFEVAFDARDAAGTVLRAVHHETRSEIEGIVDANGMTRLRFERSGVWMLKVSARESEESQHVLTATLTFEAPAFEGEDDDR